MLLADVVDTSATVAATSSRTAKVEAIADLLARTPPDEVAATVAYLTGDTRQHRLGVGWATLASLDPEPAGAPTVEVAEVHATLDRLASTVGEGSVAARKALLLDLLRRATAAEGDFLRRLLAGELRQGALAGLMAEAVARASGVPAAAVRRAAMLGGDLPAAARLVLERGAEGLTGVALQVLRPVQPMLAATSPDVASAVEAVGLASVEWKLDGARVQAHRDGDDVRLFTRNLNDVTARLPGVRDLVRSLPVRAVVLDGEVLGVGEDESPDRFQDTMSRFGRHDGDGDRLVVRFFDCLHLDGEDLLDRPLVERVAALERAAGPWRVPAVVTDDAVVAASVLDEALRAGHEGVMVKGATSPYEAGRRGRAWRKVKPVRTLDLVVLAAEWGHGRRRGRLSNLHLGACGDDGFVMVGKTFKGLTDALRPEWQTAALLERVTGRQGIVVEVRPELVVEIALDGVQASTRYPGGVALRFARVRRYREDKAPADADTIDAVRALLDREVSG